VAEIALAWVRHQAGITSTIIGAKTTKQLKDNIQSATLTLTADELKQLDDISALAKEYPGWMLERQGADRQPNGK
jgi:aryl-alcohol dehydrogenase-like predicted oxidoreductase